MTLAIDRHGLDRIHGHALEGYPSEVCGILAGERESWRVTRVVPLENERGETHNRYRVDGWTLAKTERALEREGLAIVGYYHSHPDHPATYSAHDRDHALPNMAYLIASVGRGVVHETRVWRLREDRSAMDEQPLAVRG